MFATLVYDAFAGLGCVTFALAVLALAGFGLALWLGLLPGIAEKLRRLGKEKPDGR
jgi:hypothetical protein